MKATQWLANLPEYNCPECGQKTIFKSQCSDCMVKESIRFEIEDLTKELAENNEELIALSKRRSTIERRLKELHNGKY